MRHEPTARARAVLLIFAVSLFALLAAAPASAAARCDLWAAPTGSDANPGTREQPLATPNELMRSLDTRQVGCLRGGTYVTDKYSLRSAAKPWVSLRSAPGERATLAGAVYIPPETVGLALRMLDFDVSEAFTWTGIGIDGDRTRFAGVHIDGGREHNCVSVGSTRQVYRFYLTGSRLRDCGSDAKFEHGIYLADASRAVVRGNVFERAAAWAVHVYPNADDTLVTGNVIVSPGRGGVVIAGEGDYASDRTLVTGNVIANPGTYGISGSWDARLGVGNIARGNCLTDMGWYTLPDNTISYAANRLVADTGLTDLAGGDYRLGARGCTAADYPTAALAARRWAGR